MRNAPAIDDQDATWARLAARSPSRFARPPAASFQPTPMVETGAACLTGRRRQRCCAVRGSVAFTQLRSAANALDRFGSRRPDGDSRAGGPQRQLNDEERERPLSVPLGPLGTDREDSRCCCAVAEVRLDGWRRVRGGAPNDQLIAANALSRLSSSPDPESRWRRRELADRGDVEAPSASAEVGQVDAQVVLAIDPAQVETEVGGRAANAETRAPNQQRYLIAGNEVIRALSHGAPDRPGVGQHGLLRPR